MHAEQPSIPASENHRKPGALTVVAFAATIFVPLAILLAKATSHLQVSQGTRWMTVTVITGTALIGAHTVGRAVAGSYRIPRGALITTFLASAAAATFAGWMIQSLTPDRAAIKASLLINDIVHQADSYERDVLVVERALEHPDEKSAQALKEWEAAGRPTDPTSLSRVARIIKDGRFAPYIASICHAFPSDHLEELKTVLKGDRGREFAGIPMLGGSDMAFPVLIANCEGDPATRKEMYEKVAARLSTAEKRRR